jgi:hypothetical protein
LHPFTWRTTTVIPKRWLARRGDAGRLGICPDVIECLPDIGTVRDDGDDAPQATIDGAQELEYLVDEDNRYWGSAAMPML